MSTPEGRHYPQTAEPARLPESMRNALKLMYAGAGIAVVLGVIGAVTTHSTSTHIGDSSSVTYKVGIVIGGAISGSVVGGLWLWMAWANKRGRSWARIVATVFFGVLTLYFAAALFSLPAAPKVVIILEWLAGLGAVTCLWRRQSSDYYRAMTQPADYPPSD